MNTPIAILNNYNKIHLIYVEVTCSSHKNWHKRSLLHFCSNSIETMRLNEVPWEWRALNIWQERLSRGWNERLRGQNVRLALWSLDNVTISTQFHQGQNHFKRPSAPYRILLFVVNAFSSMSHWDLCHFHLLSSRATWVSSNMWK